MTTTTKDTKPKATKPKATKATKAEAKTTEKAKDPEAIVKTMTDTMKDTLTYQVQGKSKSGKGHYPTRNRALVARGLCTSEDKRSATALGKKVFALIK